MALNTTALERVMSGKDSSVRIQDDLFRSVNGSWLATSEIPADLPYIGASIDLVLSSKADVLAIVEDLASSNPGEGAAQKIGTLFRSWMNVEELNRQGIAPLTPDLDLIAEATTHDELARAVGLLAGAAVDGFFDWWIDADLDDPSRYCLFLSQSGLGLPDEAYYR